MKKATLNYVVDAVQALLFLFLIVTGIIQDWTSGNCNPVSFLYNMHSCSHDSPSKIPSSSMVE
ncbi:MAG: hypothetical protein ACYSWY_01815 [Planctomycetota bacterium]|jgi:hypothetical protein